MIKNQNKRKGVRRNYDWNNLLSYNNHLHYTNKKSFKIQCNLATFIKVFMAVL